MTDLPVPGHQLTQISPKAYEHPADRAATAALASVPHLDTLVRKLIELGYERALRQSFLGHGVRLGADQMPEVYNAHYASFVTLDVAPIPDLYLTQLPEPNAMAVGAANPVVVVGSSALGLLEGEELRAVLAHEAGHLLSDHGLYRTALQIILRLSQSARLPLPLLPVRYALLEWFRASELSCDRAAALVTRDPMAVCRVLLAFSAGVPSKQLNADAFLRQAMDYAERGTGIERLSRLVADLGVTHAAPVRRARELLQWVHGGDYDRILAGEYLRRGDEPPTARSTASDAADHYAERFQGVFHDAGDSLNDAVSKLGEWLRRAGTRDDDDLGPDDPRRDPPPGS